MFRIIAAVLMYSALCVAGENSLAATPSDAARLPNFVQAQLREFSACAQKQSIRDISATLSPDKRMELRGAKFGWLRQDLATVRKCLERGKIFRVEKLPSYIAEGEFAFSVEYDCAMPQMWLDLNVETHGNSARVTDVGEVME